MKAEIVGSGLVISTAGAEEMLFNFHYIVDATRYSHHSKKKFSQIYIATACSAEAAVETDRVRELAAVAAQPGGVEQVNAATRAALYAAYTAALNRISEVDSYMCGEPWPLRRLNDRTMDALKEVHAILVRLCRYGLVKNAETSFSQAARSGYHDAVLELVARASSAELKADGMALNKAAANGHEAVVETLLRAGVDPAIPGKGLGTALCEAARNNRVGAMAVLLRHGAVVDAVGNGWTALYVAAKVCAPMHCRLNCSFSAPTNLTALLFRLATLRL
jgi:hypothetical protein